MGIMPQEGKTAARELYSLSQQAAELKEELTAAKEALTEVKRQAEEALSTAMISNKFSTPYGTFVKVSYTRQYFDVQRFREEYPDLYEQFLNKRHIEYVAFYPRRK